MLAGLVDVTADTREAWGKIPRRTALDEAPTPTRASTVPPVVVQFGAGAIVIQGTGKSGDELFAEITEAARRARA